MAGGVQTCQLTQIPLCGNNIMAIMVRQSVWGVEPWSPVTLPMYGRGNDDFRALDPMEPSSIQDDFARFHRMADMETMIDEGFTIGNSLPKNLKEERLRGIPVGLIYIDMKMWEAIKPKLIASLHPSLDWEHRDRLPEEWAASFMNAIQAQNAKSERDKAIADKYPDDPDMRDLFTEKWDSKGWDFSPFEKWGMISEYSSIANWLSSWSEHQTMFSLNAYFPIALKHAQAAIAADEAGEDLDKLIEIFRGIETLMLLNRAFQKLRQDWMPKMTIQEYDISPLHDEVAKLVREEYTKERDDTDEAEENLLASLAVKTWERAIEIMDQIKPTLLKWGAYCREKANCVVRIG